MNIRVVVYPKTGKIFKHTEDEFGQVFPEITNTRYTLDDLIVTMVNINEVDDTIWFLKDGGMRWQN